MSYFLKRRRFQISHRHFSLYKRFLEIKKHLIDLINIIDPLFDEILYNEVPFPGMRQGIPSLSQKLLHFADGCAAAFESAAPSFHLFDLLIGVAGAAALRLMVYCKGKNAKKYRKGVEYGSARWGGPKDIAPYIAPNFDNNILLTQTERLTMNNRPKDPKTARNKNVLVIRGSGSG